MEEMTINQIEEYLPIIKKLGIGNTPANKLKLVLSIGLLVEKEITLSRAAELAGKNIGEFIEILKLKNIPWLEYNDEHNNQDNISINKYFNS